MIAYTNIVLVKHAYTYAYNLKLDINNITILATEPKLDKRLILEMIYIHKDNNFIHFFN